MGLFSALKAGNLSFRMEPSTLQTVDLRPFKEKLRSRLPANSPSLSDLLLEPDTMSADRAAVLVPHYLRRIERELARTEQGMCLPALRGP